MALNYHYSYLVGASIFGLAWVICFVLGKKYRAQIIWGSLISGPLAVSGFLFIPQYWCPPSLFDLDVRFKVGIEDVLWSASVGGIASVIGEILLREKLSKIRQRQAKRHYAPFVAMVAVFVVLEFSRPNKSIYNTIVSLLVGALVTALLRCDLVPLMLTGALSFTALYLGLFLCFLSLYPEFVQRFYNLSGILKIYILGVPIEEMMFAASLGSVWSVAYEYAQDYRLVSFAPFRLSRVTDA